MAAQFNIADYAFKGYKDGNYASHGIAIDNSGGSGGDVDYRDIAFKGYASGNIALKGYSESQNSGDLPSAVFVYGNIPGRIAFVNRIDMPRTVNVKKPEESAIFDIVCSEDLFKGDKINKVLTIESTDEDIVIESVAINQKQVVYKPYNVKAPIGSVIQLEVSGGIESKTPVELKITYETYFGEKLEASLYLYIGYLSLGYMQ